MQRNSKHAVCLLLVMAAGVFLVCDSSDADIQNDLGIMLIPRPAKLERLEGFFTLNPETVIEAGAGARGAAGVLQEKLAAVTGMRLEIREGGPRLWPEPGPKPVPLESDQPNRIMLWVAETELTGAYGLRVKRDGIRIMSLALSTTWANSLW